MKVNVFESALKKASTVASNIHIGFQGGEPLLIGIDFYKKVISLSKEYSNRITFSIQTNGTLITPEFCQLFKENSFLVGVSLDGDEATHSRYRNSYQETIKGINLLKEHNVNYNILTVVTDNLVNNIDTVISNLIEHKYLQFIPCIDKDNQSYLSNTSYKTFLKKSFDVYQESFQKGNPISIQFFDNLLLRYLKRDVQVCTMKGRCSTQFVIEANGDVYPCDFYVDQSHKIGNILNDNYETMFNSKINQDFLKESFFDHPKCKSCDYYQLCRGGCKNDQINGLNIYCDSLYSFYEYSYNGFKKMKESLVANENIKM